MKTRGVIAMLKPEFLKNAKLFEQEFRTKRGDFWQKTLEFRKPA